MTLVARKVPKVPIVWGTTATKSEWTKMLFMGDVLACSSSLQECVEWEWQSLERTARKTCWIAAIIMPSDAWGMEEVLRKTWQKLS
eukprot:6216718-Amphidinium_carterae.1